MSAEKSGSENLSAEAAPANGAGPGQPDPGSEAGGSEAGGSEAGGSEAGVSEAGGSVTGGPADVEFAVSGLSVDPPATGESPAGTGKSAAGFGQGRGDAGARERGSLAVSGWTAAGVTEEAAVMAAEQREVELGRGIAVQQVGVVPRETGDWEIAAGQVNRQAAELSVEAVLAPHSGAESTGRGRWLAAETDSTEQAAESAASDGRSRVVTGPVTLAAADASGAAEPMAASGWPLAADGPQLPRANQEIRAVKESRLAVAANPTAEIWKSLVWLGTMVAVFLAAVTIGPRVIEQYQYAATRGKMRAQYEAASEVLSRVSFRETSVSSELVVHRIRPSVVSIHAKARATRRNREGYVRGQGSGVIISEDGLIVTNNHVIDGAENLVVTLADRREFLAKIVGRDNETDLAVLKIDAVDLIPAEWGDSDALELGSSVWAMGSPFGLDQTVTRGIISGKHRRTADNSGQANPHQDLLQTDAAINPGNSGGPLVNSSGQVVGINTSIYGEFFQGISFAVPSALAKEIVAKLIKHGEVRRGFLGVFPSSVTHQDAIRLNLPDISGAILTLVEPDAPAGRAGLQVDDVIVRIGGQPIDNDVLLFRQIALTDPGAETVIDYFRDGALVSTTVKVGHKPSRRF